MSTGTRIATTVVKSILGKGGRLALTQIRRVLAHSLFTIFLTRIMAILAAFLVCGVLILAMGKNPIAAYSAVMEGTLGSVYNVSATMAYSTPLIFAALGIVLAFRCKVWNIGAEGQLYMGALIATVLGITPTGIPSFLLLPVIILAGFLGGAVWGAIPGVLKARLEVSEVITTLMMNYVTILGVSAALSGPIKDPGAMTWPQSPAITTSAWLPVLIPGTQLHAGFIMALVGAVVAYVIIEKTTLGYNLRAVGFNPEAARTAGISVKKTIVAAMILSGGFAGLAGVVQILGYNHRLIDYFSPGYGFTAILVGLVANLHPIGVILVALFFAGLTLGGDSMQVTTQVPIYLMYVVQGLIILFLIGERFFLRIPVLLRGHPRRHSRIKSL